MAVDKIPFDKRGNMMEYAGYYGDTVWINNEPFDCKLNVIGFERGRSAARVIMQCDTTGARYPMFLSSFVEMTQQSTVSNGSITGRWVGCKKGQNYGIKLAVA
jgi:hypothetical protein